MSAPLRPTHSQASSLIQFARSASISAAQNPAAERFAKLSNKIHILADREIQVCQEEAAANGMVPACRPGCDFCCHRLCSATLPEVLEALSYVRQNFSEEDLSALRTRCQASQSENQDYWACRSWNASAACPFLRQGLCTIYSARPLSCRVRNSTDAEICGCVYLNGERLDIEGVPGQLDQLSANQEVIDALRDQGIASGSYELAPAVLTFIDHPEKLADLSRVNPDLERTKLVSEMNGNERPPSTTMSAALGNPLKREVLELIGKGLTEQAVSTLARCETSAFKCLYDLVLPFQYETAEEIEEYWHRYDGALRRFEEANLASKEVFDLVEQFTTYPLAYTAKNIKPYLGRLMQVLAGHAVRAYPQFVAPFESSRRAGPLRVGFISHRLGVFNGSRWAFGWMSHMPKDIETWAINLSPIEDDITARFRRTADHFFHFPYQSPQVAALIRRFDLDALIFTDLGMSGTTLQLACFRLARKQLTAWGHPVTSGSPQIDCYLSSDLMEPPNGQDHYTERMVRLPGSGLTYPRFPLTLSNKTAEDFGLPNTGFLLFAQNSLKLAPPFEEPLIEIAERSKKPLAILSPPGDLQIEPLRKRFEKVASKVVFLPRQEPEDYLRLLQLADANLDCECWNGGNTTIEALTLGTPTVSIAGEYMRGRHALAFLPPAGVGDLIANSREKYVEIALNSALLREARTRIDAEPLYEDPRPAKALAELLLNSN